MRRDLYYLAGFIDGEGHFCLTPNKNGQGRPYLRPDIIVSQNTIEVLEYIREAFGGRISVQKKSTWDGGGTRILYRWEINGRKAVELAKKLEPHLIVKRDQVRRISTIKYNERGWMIKPNIVDTQPMSKHTLKRDESNPTVKRR